MSDDSNPRIADRTERNAATSFRDNAAGPPVEQAAVTGRPNDLAGKVGNTTIADRAKGVSGIPTGGDSRNSTLADRSKGGRKGAKAVAADGAEDKAVKPATTKRKG